MTQRQVGDIAGVDQATVGRWLRSEKTPTDAGVVARLAQGFGRNPLEAFVAAGFLTIEEAGRGLDAESIELLGRLTRAVTKRDETTARQKREAAAMSIAASTLLEQAEQGAIIGAQALHDAINDARRRVELPERKYVSNSYVEEMVTAMLHVAADNRNRHLTIDDIVEEALAAPDAPDPATGDAARLALVVAELDEHDLAKAARHTGRKGKVAQAREAQDEVGHESQDDGGMDPA